MTREEKLKVLDDYKDASIKKDDLEKQVRQLVPDHISGAEKDELLDEVFDYADSDDWTEFKGRMEIIIDSERDEWLEEEKEAIESEIEDLEMKVMSLRASYHNRILEKHDWCLEVRVYDPEHHQDGGMAIKVVAEQCEQAEKYFAYTGIDVYVTKSKDGAVWYTTTFIGNLMSHNI